MIRLGPPDYREMPWKNGGGSTTELLLSPPGAGLDAFAWRISRARVAASGPFSPFPGCDRTLLLLDGEGLVLEREEGSLVLPGPFHPAAFPGDGPTFGRLLGAPCRDFNVISRRGGVRHRVEVASLAGGALEARPCWPGAFLVLYGAEGEASLSAAAWRGALEPGHLLRLDPGEACRLEAGEARVILVHLLEASGA